MPLSALPERLQTAEAWQNTDMDNIFQRWILKNPWIHGLLAWGPRAKEWWGKWREIPKTIVAIHGSGPLRWEFTDGNRPTIADIESTWCTHRGKSFNNKGYYLSRIQYWTRWHLQIQWPFMIAFHIYFSNNSIIDLGTNSGAKADGKLFYFYLGAHRDSDLVYWFPSAYIGLNWK